MVSIEKAVVARLETQGLHFEVLLEPEVARRLRDNEPVTDDQITEALAIDTVFKDSRKGDRATDESVRKVFGNATVPAIVRQIVAKGEFQLTTDQRREMLENKRKAIVAYIARNAINPQTKTPHPPQRIELAMEEAKVRVDPFKPVEAQVKDVLGALKVLLPIRFEKATIAVKLSGENYARCLNDMKTMGTIIRDEWQDNGSWVGLVEMPAGMQTDFLKRLNDRTKGNVETKIVRSE